MLPCSAGGKDSNKGLRKDRQYVGVNGNWCRSRSLLFAKKKLRGETANMTRFNSTDFHRLYQKTPSRKNHSFLHIFANLCAFINIPKIGMFDH